MLSQSKQRVFIPVMLVGFLLFGAAAAQAHDDRGDRVARGAVIGAVVGTFIQLAQGRNEGRELLNGAVVGGALGAAAGAFDGARRDRYRHRAGSYYDDRYRDSYPAGESYQGGYNGPVPSYGYDGESGYDGYGNGGYPPSSASGYDDGYGRDDRYDRYDQQRPAPRRGNRCRHR
jgi:uncharacterized protein YcfJ